ncbi:unnamed protein product [Mytilus edulis]|uniref:Uncharacterized protein n=1 Tax=Mytilus edulis TaxID=6550 RepID=A0A8S3T3K6_MYTED|nr:unnamed protein product [Mytilus edulis]
MADSPDPEIQFHAPPPEFGQGDDQNEHDDHEYEEERRYSRAFENGDTISRPKGNNRSFYIKPDSYSGSSDWDEYYSHFEDCVELGGLVEKDKCLTLAASLRGPARTFYISLTIAEKEIMIYLYQNYSRDLDVPDNRVDGSQGLNPENVCHVNPLPC